MKLKKVLPLFFLSCSLALIGCGSTPAPEEPAPEPVVEEPIATEPTPAQEPAPEPEPEPVKEEKQDFSNANSQLLEGTESARKEAEDANARKYYADKFSELDEELNNLKKENDANPSEDRSEKLRDLTAKYNALAKAARAKAMKEKIDEMDLSSADKPSYDAGSKALDEFASLGKDATGSEMLSKANVAFESFTTVFSKAFKALCATERKAALEAKKNADSVKAGVSQKDAYTKASDMFKKADVSFVTNDIEGAYKGYSESKLAFTELFEKVSEARKAAAEAIERAKAKAKESSDYTLEADGIAPLGDGEVKGIEAEDAKLLEDDNFEDAEKAEIDVEEGDTAKQAAAEAEILAPSVEGSEAKPDEVTKELKESLEMKDAEVPETAVEEKPAEPEQKTEEAVENEPKIEEPTESKVEESTETKVEDAPEVTVEVPVEETTEVKAEVAQ